MNYGIGNVKGKGGGGKTYFYADFDDLTYDSQNARYTIDKSNVWCNFLSTLQTSNDFKVGDFLYACDFNVNGNGLVKLLLEIVSVGSTDLTLSECLDYAEQSSGIYYANATLNAVGQTTQVALSNIQVNTNNSRNVLHENDLIIDANKKIGGVVSISNGVATIFTIMELGGGGKQLYQHVIYGFGSPGDKSFYVYFTITNDSDTHLDFTAIKQYLSQHNLIINTANWGASSNRPYPATGRFYNGSNWSYIDFIAINVSNSLLCVGSRQAGSVDSLNIQSNYFEDTVIAL